MLIGLNVFTILVSQIMYLAHLTIGYVYVGLLIVEVLLYSLSLLIFRLIPLCSMIKQCKCSVKLLAKEFLNLSAGIGDLCYLLGGNIVSLVAFNAEDLNCNKDCLLAVGDAATMLLVIASLLFYINEIQGGKLQALLKSKADNDGDHEWHVWGNVAESIAFIRIFHSSFLTVATRLTDITNTCISFEKNVTWIMFTTLMVIWSVHVIVSMSPGIKRSLLRHNIRGLFKVLSLALIVISVAGFIMIASNDEPLACAFNCDILSRNFTKNCDEAAYHGARITLLSTSLIFLTILCIGLIIRFIKLTKNVKEKKDNNGMKSINSVVDRNITS